MDVFEVAAVALTVQAVVSVASAVWMVRFMWKVARDRGF